MSLPVIAEAFIDADFAIKLGRYMNRDMIVEVLPKIAGMIFIHKYVFEEEILVPPRVKEQLNKLVELGKAKVVDPFLIEGISSEPDAFRIYQETIQLLAAKNVETIGGRSHWGETVSLAAAKVMNVPFFLSDESRLQELVDVKLNSNDPNRTSPGDIRVYRIVDLIREMREIGEDRKTAKEIWIKSGKKADAMWRKEFFQRELWPVEQLQNLQ